MLYTNFYAMKLILLAQNEGEQVDVLANVLEHNGYRVCTATNGVYALKLFKNMMPDIVVLDVILSVIDGYEVATAIRRTNRHVPIMFLSSRCSTSEILESFKAGANDFMRKPFIVEELLARMQVMLKQTVSNTLQYEIGGFLFDVSQQTLMWHGRKISISYKESQLLMMLCDNKNAALPKEQMQQRLWGTHTMQNSRNIDVLITRLRAHLSLDETVKIINLRGIGYKLVAED